MEVYWILFYATGASILAFSYGYLITSLRKRFEQDYDEIKQSFLIFFLLEINLYLFYVICHILTASSVISRPLFENIDFTAVFIVPYLQAACLLYFKDSKDNL